MFGHLWTLCISGLKGFFTLRKIPKFRLISWCGYFVETQTFRKVSGESPETLRKLRFSIKFPHQETTWSFGILHSVHLRCLAGFWIRSYLSLTYITCSHNAYNLGQNICRIIGTISVHHKWKRTRLLSTESTCTSCRKTRNLRT